MEFRVLGSTEVIDGAQLRDLPQGRGRALLALLILHAGEPVSAQRLIDELWDDHPPPTANTVVQGLVSRLRNTLEPGRRKGDPSTILQTLASSYRLASDRDSVDAFRFRRLVDEARQSPPDVRAAKLAQALELWRGPALADFTYVPFAQRAISALEALKIEASEELVEVKLVLGQSSELVADLEQLVRAHPFRERLHAALMLALYRAGRQAEALEAYHAARRVLVEEIGVEPGFALRDLESAILRHDPSLRLAERPTVSGDTGQADAWLGYERRPVTVVSVDVAPAPVEGADIEAVTQLGAHAVHVASQVFEQHGARVERMLGDLLMAFFGFPMSHEDDAVRACRATVEMGRVIEALNTDPPQPRAAMHRWSAGVESGDVVTAGPLADLHDVGGTVLNVATRLQQQASDGTVLIGSGTQRLVRGTVIMRPEGTRPSGPESVFQLLDVPPHMAGQPAGEAPMFGRQVELTHLRSTFRRAVTTHSTVLASVLGEPGIGKSRLARELIASIGTEAHAITLRCPPHGDLFYPLRAGVVEAAGLTGWRTLHDLLASGEDAARVPSDLVAAIGLPAEPRHVDDLTAALRRLVTTLATIRPLVVVLDDLHWAPPAFLEIVEKLGTDLPEPIMLLCLARRDELSPTWKARAPLELAPLSTDELELLVRDRAGSIPSDVLHRTVELAQGNPLFAEQLLAAGDDGLSGEVPSSLLGLLNMRLDRLGPGERDLLRSASIIGIDFDEEALAILMPDDARPFMQRHLDTLERRTMIDRVGTRSFRFRHALIQLTAYRSTTRADRERLHAALTTRLRQASTPLSPRTTR